MPRFSKSSMTKLQTCHEKLQILFLHVVTHYDCTIVEGHRGKKRQQELYNSGKSKVQYPHGKHNTKPSLAVDAAPYINGISWDTKQCYNFAGFVLGCASMMGIKLRWGGDWDKDRNIHDQTFNDLVHFELEI